MRRRFGGRRSTYGRPRRSTRRVRGRGFSRRRRVSNRTPRAGRIGYRL